MAQLLLVDGGSCRKQLHAMQPHAAHLCTLCTSRGGAWPPIHAAAQSTMPLSAHTAATVRECARG